MQIESELPLTKLVREIREMEEVKLLAANSIKNTAFDYPESITRGDIRMLGYYEGYADALQWALGLINEYRNHEFNVAWNNTWKTLAFLVEHAEKKEE
jgi:hypothetical protein